VYVAFLEMSFFPKSGSRRRCDVEVPAWARAYLAAERGGVIPGHPFRDVPAQCTHCNHKMEYYQRHVECIGVGGWPARPID
jgi:hypothetical protein